jgi:hypothetical protein
MPPEFEPEPILAALARHAVDYVLIGGFATVQYGSPFLTQDLDITPERSEENLRRLSAALTDLGARIRTMSEPEGLPFRHTASSLRDAGVWNLVTEHGDLDISFVPNGTEGFDDLTRDAAGIEIYGIEVRVASLADIIRSKQAANRPKDQRVLPTLREILASRHAKNHPPDAGT